jgi:hypothetical protein
MTFGGRFPSISHIEATVLTAGGMLLSRRFEARDEQAH